MSSLTFNVLIARREELDAKLTEAGKALKAIPGVGSGPMGLTPDDVKQSVEFRVAKRAVDTAFAQLRAINGHLSKFHKNELRAESIRKRAEWERKQLNAQSS